MSKSIKSIPDQAFFHVVTRAQPVDSLIASLYQNPDQTTKGHFLSVNQHLQASVLPGQVVVVTPPGQTVCTAFEYDLAEVVADIERMQVQLSPKEADFVAKNYEMINNLMAHSGTAIGVSTTFFQQHKKRLENLLKQLERLYVSTYNSGRKLNKQRFYQQRQAIFNQMNAVLRRMLGQKFSGTNLQVGNLKNSLGLSTKSILHQWNQVPGKVQTIPDFADNYARVGKYGKLLSRIGYGGVLLDIGQSGVLIHQACTTGREEECTRSKYVQGGRLGGSLIGSYVGGALGGYMGYSTCNVIFFLPSGGTSLFWCGIVGAAAGGFTGGSLLGRGAQEGGSILYEAIY